MAMNNKLKVISMPNNEKFEVFDWYGVCNTSSSTRAKYVNITGFSSNSLQEGVRVVVQFTYAQTYNGVPTLNISGTGAKQILNRGGTYAGTYEWDVGAIISFIYYNDCWAIEDGGHATTTYYGKTKLSNTITNDQTTALTPSAVYNAGYLTLADLPIYDGTVV